MSNGEKIVKANGVDLCVETFGDSSDPAILLVHGASASMIWWETELCERIAQAGRYVIRFDNRDTGKSVSYPPGQPGYALTDMTDDAVGILDALGVERAHLVGRSLAGAIVLLAAQRYPDRVASLTLVTTTTGGSNLPPPSGEFINYTSSGGPNPGDPKAVTDFIVGLMRIYSGPSPYFDEDHQRELAHVDIERTDNIASCLTNHFVIDTSGSVDFGAIDVPTLVVHGEQDPVFPIEHGQALQKAIPTASLLVLEKAGHEVPAGLWDVFVADLVAHTNR
ncbi:alpha/beta hydrolase [Solwaraspora sp. WMMD406]|uniref:alpha/beta fold hydrolase n=1 Tax=Solwaraspora sp. WMMD406 TaxID=3016095 RepID=UPI002417AF27|nr:alpha/beta hydrolase [Solwaraspora sp. WMMD406]MDG4766910.1 alpha/beta hydrolase [Solwaraspora sp. WMMD406]